MNHKRKHTKPKKQSSSSSKLKLKLKRALYDLFLPIDYPKSVNPGYIQYQAYDLIQGLSSYLRGVVTTTAILTAAGVGNSEATATSAAVQWAMKDGCGMIGGLIFSFFCSSYFDSHVKEFRLFADIMNDIGLFLDMLLPSLILMKYSSFFILGVSTFATLCRVMCGMAAGATKNCITQHFAKKGNTADLSAKEGTQETLVSLIGMVLGIALARYLQDMEESCKVLRLSPLSEPEPVGIAYVYDFFYRDGSFNATWFVFLFLTIVHVWSNYIGVKILKLKTLNRARCEMALEKVLLEIDIDIDINKGKNSMPTSTSTSTSTSTLIIAPHECCESLYKSWKNLTWGDNIRLGMPISIALQGISTKYAQTISTLYQHEGYIITIARKRSNLFINVALRTGYYNDMDNDNDNDNDKDNTVVNENESSVQLKAFLHAKILQRYLNTINRSASRNIVAKENEIVFMSILEQSKLCIDGLFPPKGKTVLDLLEDRGWNVETLHLDFVRCDFDIIDSVVEKEDGGDDHEE